MQTESKEYLFRAKSHGAHLFKVLSEILQSNLKTACFQLKPNGIFLRQMDANRRTLIDLKMESENFNLFKFDGQGSSSDSMFVGLTLTHLHKMMKSIKKKDSICLYILKSNPNELAIQVIPKENNRITTSYLKVQRVQNILVDVPSGYDSSVIIPSAEFQKISKDILAIGKTIRIKSQGNKLEFGVDSGGILKRTIEVGDIDDETPSGPLFDQTFQSEQLLKITKLSNLSNFVHIHTSHGQPLLFSSRVGDLGKISIYIKNKDQILADGTDIHC
jgi:proliferating cell nuclear antigen